jgi:hypothetical protein
MIEIVRILRDEGFEGVPDHVPEIACAALLACGPCL